MAYRRTEHVEARLADNRNRILSAARALVSEGGWSEAQVSHVASAAGLATGTVYRYFPSLLLVDKKNNVLQFKDGQWSKNIFSIWFGNTEDPGVQKMRSQILN